VAEFEFAFVAFAAHSLNVMSDRQLILVAVQPMPEQASAQESLDELLLLNGVKKRLARAFKEILWPFGVRIFGFWRGFGEGTGSNNPVTESKRSQNLKRPLPSSIQPDGYSISLKALKASVASAGFRTKTW
jgi:hypothetical protein